MISKTIRIGAVRHLALAIVAGVVAVAIIVLTALGSEARGVAFGTGLSPDTATSPIPKGGLT